MKVIELEGGMLDYWTCRALDYQPAQYAPNKPHAQYWLHADLPGCRVFNPFLGDEAPCLTVGYLITRFRISIRHGDSAAPGGNVVHGVRFDGEYVIASCKGSQWNMAGRTLMEAICRAVVLDRYGLSVPDDPAAIP